jgi:hypothetical protein
MQPAERTTPARSSSVCATSAPQVVVLAGPVERKLPSNPMALVGAIAALLGAFNLVIFGSQAGGRELLESLLCIVLVLVLIVALIVYLQRAARRKAVACVQATDPSPQTWVSRRAVLIGPFRDTTDLIGGATLIPRSLNAGVAGVYIGITHEGVTLIGERSRQLTCLWQAIKSIELFRGPHERRVVVTRRALRQAGSMVLTTADGKTATIAGVSPEPLARALTQLGIAVQQQAKASPKSKTPTPAAAARLTGDQ